MTKTKRRILVISSLVLLVLIIVGLSAQPLLENVIVPQVVRYKVRSEVGDAWRGSVSVEEVSFNMKGPLRIGGIKLVDDSDRTWATLDRVQIDFKDWPGFSPSVSAISAETVKATAYFRDGRCWIPLRKIEPEPGREPMEIPTVSVERLILNSVNETPKHPQRWGVIAYGFGENKNPSETVAKGFPVAFRRLNVQRAKWNGTELNVKDINGSFSGEGRFKCDVDLNREKEGTFRAQAQVTLKNLPLADLVPPHADGKPAPGILHGDYRMSWIEGGVIDGQGQLLLNNADLWTVPVLGNVLNIIHKGIDPLTFSDANAEFKNAGPVITFQKLQIANALSAIVGEPGSKLDLKRGTVDGAVFAAPLKTIRAAMAKIPVVKIFVQMSDTFTRLEVSGPVDSPRISKRPMDIVEGTLEAFEQTARDGTNLAEDIGSKVTGWLKFGN